MASSKRFGRFAAGLLVLSAGLVLGGCQARRAETASAPDQDDLDRKVEVAVAQGDCTGLRRWLAKGGNPQPPKAKYPPLVRAASAKRFSCVQALLDAGADPDAAMADGTTALLLVSRHVDRDIVDALLARGADATKANQSGVAPLAAAAGSGDAVIVDRLLQHGAVVDAASLRGWTALHHAIAQNRSSIVVRLLSAGADVAHQDVLGTTPLLLAAAVCEACVPALLDHGADLDTPNRQGITPLMAAAQNSRTATVELLLRRGARTDLRDRSGRGYLDWAAQAPQP